MEFLKELNEEQYLAATSFEGPVLILAGAGSGKTKTVIARTANMISNGIDPTSILVLTFTNKAAKEMKERGENLLEKIEYSGEMPDFTTFHSWGMRFVRKYVDSIPTEISKNFSIADEGIQESIIKELIQKVYGDGTKKDIPFKVPNFQAISTILQNNLITYKSFKETEDEIRALITAFKKAGRPLKFFVENGIETADEFKKLVKIYVLYKVELRKNNLVDFDDLINLSIKILKENRDIKEKVKEQYRYIMIDEFQDTNFAQIELMNLILNQDDNICVVGDDSQSIYGWRGADIEYILNFHKKFRKVLKINLVHNYRSTKDIVNRANELLLSATQKHEFKEALRAFTKDKGTILNKTFDNQNVEAMAVSYYISQLISKGAKPESIAILYRSNFIVPAFEKELIKKRIPYKIFKGRTLLQKKSIQEYIQFFQCFVNEKNSISIEQALLSKAKYIGPSKLDEIKKELDLKEITLADYLFNDQKIDLKLSKSIQDKLDSFVTGVKTVRTMMENEATNREIADYFYHHFSLVKEHQRTVQESTSVASKEASEKAITDMALLTSILCSFNSLEEFLETVTLDSAEEEDENASKVNLMTVHASKGLEFEYVFVVRFNQGVFPSNRSLTEPLALEEERRLAYVAITRAKKFLHISNAKMGFNGPMAPSQFIKEAGLDK